MNINVNVANYTVVETLSKQGDKVMASIFKSAGRMGKSQTRNAFYQLFIMKLFRKLQLE